MASEEEKGNKKKHITCYKCKKTSIITMNVTRRNCEDIKQERAKFLALNNQV